MAGDPDVANGEEAPAPSPGSVVLQNLDVVLVAVAIVPAIELGAPVIGVLLGGGGWIATRMLEVFNQRWVAKFADPVKQLATNLFEAFARIWILAGMIVLAAWLGERPDGLTAALMIFGAYSVSFVSRLFYGALRARGAK
jgi:hypothetical protein